MAKKLLECFMKKNCKKQIKKSLDLKTVIKTNGDTLYVKWKGYDNSFNSCVDKKRYQCIKWTIFPNRITVVKAK